MKCRSFCLSLLDEIPLGNHHIFPKKDFSALTSKKMYQQNSPNNLPPSHLLVHIFQHHRMRIDSNHQDHRHTDQADMPCRRSQRLFVQHPSHTDQKGSPCNRWSYLTSVRPSTCPYHRTSIPPNLLLPGTNLWDTCCMLNQECFLGQKKIYQPRKLCSHPRLCQPTSTLQDRDRRSW